MPHEQWNKELVNIKLHGKASISIMVWAAIFTGGRTELIVMVHDEEAKRKGFSAKSYIKALEEGLLPVYFGDRVFQQDNARIHTAEIVENWFMEHGIEVIEWPPHSPDLNPIEHVWKALKGHLTKITPNLQAFKNNKASIAFIKAQLQIAWNAIPQEQTDHLIMSLPRRLKAVIKAKGWYTKY